MKLLRIQGKNLASIAGEFDIDFTTEPLRSAGVFTICGPTGSGKSTILDAICLALYNTTPRMTGVEGAKVTDIGKEQVQQGDRRQILRRGTTEAYAVVEFIAIDGKSYRSVWRVWRANNKVNGKLQPAELKVYDLSTESPLTNGISEAENKLIQLTGLNYNQFTRTVLLAQNDFARFLKARKDEKAEVLEKLTGTEIYSIISNTVYNRTTALRTDCKLLNERMGNIRLLNDTELKELRNRQNQLQQVEKELQQKQKDTQHKIKWYEQLAVLDISLKEAMTSFEIIRQAKQDAQPQAEWLQQIDSVEASRTLWHEKTECAASVRTQAEHLREYSVRLSELTAETRKTGEKEKYFQDSVDKLTQTYASYKPLLQKARHLDIDIIHARTALKESLNTLEIARTLLQEQEKIRQERKEQILLLDRQTEQLHCWFTKNKQHEQMCLNINMIDDFLTSACSIHQEIINTEQKFSALQQQEKEEEQRYILQKNNLNSFTAQCSEITARQREIQEKLAQIRITEVRKQKNRLQNRKELFAGAMLSLEVLRQKQKEIEKNEARLSGLQTRLSDLGIRLQENTSQLKTTEIQRDTLRKSLENATLAASASVGELRIRLADGQPCPVCGSLHHPYMEEKIITHSTLGSLQRETETSENEFNRLHSEHVRLQTELTHLTETAANLNDDLKQVRENCEEMRMRWRDQSSELQIPYDIQEEELKKISSEVSDALQQLSMQENEWEAQNTDLQNTVRQLEQFRAETEKIQTELQQTQSRSLQIRTGLSQYSGILENLRKQQAEVLSKSDRQISIENWRERWLKDHDSFSQELRAAANKWQSKVQQLENCEKQKVQLHTEQAENEKNLLQYRKSITGLNEIHQARSVELNRLQQERSLLLEGKSAEEFEQLQLQSIEENSRLLEAVRKEKEIQNAGLQTLKGQYTQQQIIVSQLDTQLQQSSFRLEEWLKNYNTTAPALLTETSLSTLLSVPQSGIQSERSRQAQLRDRLTAAQATLAEREKQLELHKQLPDRPDLQTESSLYLQSLLEDYKMQSEEIDRQKTAIAAELFTQEENRKQAKGLRQEAEEKADILNKWSKLDDLIGSQSGYKFKEIAQGYTLDILLSYANKQLKELTPRYQLQRVPDELALQIIDHDLCDEVRSVFSLSGGESFLVSLALALGLSSFSARNHYEENLFIDEGFGTLDAETLQIVMEALERLRSQGRQVGIISHVHELAERIPVRINLVKTGNGKSKVVIE